MKISFKEQVLPHLIALILFFLITLVLFHPYFLENKNLSQHDILQWKGSAQELVEFRQEQGEEALWTNRMFSGMPAWLIDVKWSNQPVVFVHKLLAFGLPHPVRIAFLCMLSYYILLLCFRIRPWLAISGALAFALSTYMLVGLGAGHNARISAIAFMPLVIGGIHLSFRKQYLLAFALTSLGLALHFRVNHLQITYYLLLMVLLYGLVELVYLIKDKKLKELPKSLGVLVLAAILATGTFMGEFLATYQYAKFSMRGPSELQETQDRGEAKDGLEKDYAFNYSNGIMEPLTLFIPNVLGGSSQQKLSKNSNLGEELRRNGLSGGQLDQQLKSVPTYWGDQPLTAPYYAGAVMVFLMVLGFVFGDKKIKIWLGSLLALAILLSWGKNFESLNYFLFDYLPGYNKFRSVTFIIVMAIFSIPLLGLHGLENFLKNKDQQLLQKKFLYALGGTAGFCLLTLLFSGMFSYRGAVDAQMGNLPNWFLDALLEDRKALLRKDTFRSLVFVLLAGAAIYAHAKAKLQWTLLGLGLCLLVMVDMLPVGKRVFNKDNFQRSPEKAYFQLNEADKRILADERRVRVFNLQNPFNEARTSYFHESLGGYHGAKIRRYQDLIDKQLNPELSRIIEQLRAGEQSLENVPVANMLNTGYFVFGSEASAVLPNPTACGNAWMVQKVEYRNSPDEVLSSLGQIDPKSIALADKNDGNFKQENYTGDGKIELISYTAKELQYQYNSDSPSLAVFSEIYHPKGWKAYVDGDEVPIQRVNYILRALDLPAGNFEITFRFEPQVYQIGNTVTLITSWIWILAILGSFGISLRNGLEKNNEE